MNLFDFLFPPVCPHCGTHVQQQGDWCDACIEEVLHVRQVPSKLLSSLDSAWILADYRGGIKSMIYDVKFNEKKEQSKGAAPYLARLFENSILEVNKGIIEAAQSMGASHFEVIWHFLLPEAKGSLILSITTGTIGLIGATAMAGAIGAGGVGDLALTYGYERLNFPLMLFTVVILIIFVQIIQTIGNYFARRTRRS